MAARAPSFRLESPAPARSTGAPTAPPAEAGRARPPHTGRLLGLPLNDHHLRRIAEIERIVGTERYRGWGRIGLEAGRRPDGGWQISTWEDFFVDVLDEDGSLERHYGDTLHVALGSALRAARGAR